MRKLAMALVASTLVFAAASAAAEDYDLDQKIPLDDKYDAPLTLEAVGVTFTGVRIKDAPTAAQVAAASSRSSTRPDVEVSFKNGNAREVRVILDVTLEDAMGNVILSCKRAKNLDPGEDSDASCPNTGVYLRDWPRVKVFHLKASVGKR